MSKLSDFLIPVDTYTQEYLDGSLALRDSSINWLGEQVALLDASIALNLSAVDQDYLPKVGSTINIGASDNRIDSIYANDVYIAQNSLWINDKKVLSDESDVITVSTSVNQDLQMLTTGSGDSKVQSDNGILLNVTSDYSSKDIELRTDSASGSLILNANGTSGTILADAKGNIEISSKATTKLIGNNITFDSSNAISFNNLNVINLDTDGLVVNNDASILGNLSIANNIDVGGNLTINGSLYVINTGTIDVSGSFINLNSGLTGPTPSFLQSGMVVERGDGEPYIFVYDEDNQTFRIGISHLETSTHYLDSSTQAVATREDIPEIWGVGYWNSTEYRFDTSTGFTFTPETGLNIPSNLAITGDTSISGNLYNLGMTNVSTNYTVYYNPASDLLTYALAPESDSGIAWSGSTANGVATYGDANTVIAESNLIFDGDILTAPTFRTTSTNTSYNYFYRNSASPTILVQASGGDIASFRYGSTTPGEGTEVMRVQATSVDVSGNFNISGGITAGDTAINATSAGLTVTNTLDGDGGWARGIHIVNTGTAGEAAISFKNSITDPSSWIVGQNQNSILKFAYGQSFLDGYTKLSLNTDGDLTITGTYTGAGTGLTGTASSLSIGGNAATATSATSATSATNATNAANITVADESSDTACNVLFVTAATGTLPPKTGTNLTFNAVTGILTATGFAGALTGNVTGDVTGSSGSCTGNAATATKLANINTTFTGSYPMTVNVNGVIYSHTGCTFTGSTGTLAATTFDGNLTGNVTGNVSGSSGSCTGNAATASNAALLDSLDSTDFARYSAGGGLSNSLADAAWICSSAPTTNIDHVWHDDTGNAWNFCSDTTFKGTANSRINAGSFYGAGTGLTGTASSLTAGACSGAAASNVLTAGDTMTGALIAADHGTAATDQVVNVCYGTGDPPTASTTTIGTLYVKYTA